MGNSNSSQTRRRRSGRGGADMFAGFQPGTQVDLGVRRPGAQRRPGTQVRPGAGRHGARRWQAAIDTAYARGAGTTIDRNHLDTMDPASYALVRDLLTRQYLAAHGPVVGNTSGTVVAPRGRPHVPAPGSPVVVINRQGTPWRTAREERATAQMVVAEARALRRFAANPRRPGSSTTVVHTANDSAPDAWYSVLAPHRGGPWDGRAMAPWLRDRRYEQEQLARLQQRGLRYDTRLAPRLAAEAERLRQQQRRREAESRRVRRLSKLRTALKRMIGRKKPPTGEAAECVVCLDEATSVKLNPCGHLVLCEACSLRVDVCPVCRGPIAERRATA